MQNSLPDPFVGTYSCVECGQQGINPGDGHVCSKRPLYHRGFTVDQLPDSGKRRKFETGSQRDTREGKGRCDLLPPLALLQVALHFERGAAKYEERNWEKGQDLGSYFDSALRHIFRYMYFGPDREDHLAAAAWNLLCALETRERVTLGHLPERLINIPIKREKQLAHDPFEAGGL